MLPSVNIYLTITGKDACDADSFDNNCYRGNRCHICLSVKMQKSGNIQDQAGVRSILVSGRYFGPGCFFHVFDCSCHRMRHHSIFIHTTLLIMGHDSIHIDHTEQPDTYRVSSSENLPVGIDLTLVSDPDREMYAQKPPYSARFCIGRIHAIYFSAC